MKHKFYRLDNVWRIIIIALLLMFLWIWVWNSSRMERRAPYVIPKSIEQHLTHYCNFPVRTSGAEGSLSLEDLEHSKRFRLEMVHVLIRHGDRSPAMDIANMDHKNYDYDCTFKTADRDHKQMFEEFKQTSMYFKLREFVKGVRTSQSLIPSGKKCEIGQLTQRGFLQHFEIGKHMREVYHDFLGDDITGGNLLLRSTERTRCIQSAAAFLFGLLTKDTIMREGIAINLTSDIWLREDDHGVPYKCPSFYQRWAEYKQRQEYITGAAEMEPFMQKYSQILGTSRSSITTVIFLTDAILTRYCYKHPLPCGPGGCVTQEMAADGINFASWAFAENFTAIADVATHPMLIQMAKRMIDKSRDKTKLKFILYSAHDSTVTPLLLNLGVHDRNKWTPYATRVVIELWRDTTSSVSSEDSIESLYFRVLVNGKAVTSKMKFCGEALFKGELCPVRELITWLSAGKGVKGMDENYQSLCNT